MTLDVVLKIEPSATDTESGNFLDNVAFGDLKKCVQEKLESLLSPNSKSLYLFIECPQVAKKKPKPKDSVIGVLNQYAPYNIYVLYFTDVWNLDSGYWITPQRIQTMHVCAQSMCPRVALQNG